MDLFGTAGIRGPVETEVTPRLALEVGQAIGAPDREFVLGRDGRVTGETISAAMRAGLESAGSTVRKVSVVPTPTLAFASQDRYGVQVTASHNPAFDSGIKLFDDGVELDSEAERVVSKAVSEGPTPPSW
ncbi:MAG: phosphomannomutase, partial [Halodesulfurarchaeum sp.]